jgi:hypothetical protein
MILKNLYFYAFSTRALANSLTNKLKLASLSFPVSLRRRYLRELRFKSSILSVNLSFCDAKNNSLTYLKASSIYGKSAFFLWVMIPFVGYLIIFIIFGERK